MKTSDLIRLLTELMNTEGDPEVIVAFEVDNPGAFQEGSIVQVRVNSEGKVELEAS